MKNFFRHWHYGIKARVVDGALVSYIDTAVEPKLLRLDFGRLQGVFLDVQTKDGFHDLVMTGIGGPAGAAIALARFEVREAAEEAAACIRCALIHGQRWRGHFCKMFAGTLGVLAALIMVLIVGSLTSGGSIGNINAMKGEMTGMASSLAVPGVATGAAPEAGVPQSADQFLNSR